MCSIPLLLPLCLILAEPPADKEQTERWMRYYAKIAGSYQLYFDDKPETPLAFHPQSILQYSNPVRERGQHGAVFVWTHEGRPEAIGTIWSIRNRADPTKRRTSHEFHSLSLSALRSVHPETMRLGDRGLMPQWQTVEPGIQLAAVPNAPDAGSSKAIRLIQMRQMARRFSAVSISRDGDENALRLLPHPLFRYTSQAANVIDGVLFAMVMGTDPELLLMLELREVDGAAQWQFAACRCTGLPLRLQLNKKIVWQCDKAKTWVGNRPYFFCVGVSELDEDLP